MTFVESEVWRKDWKIVVMVGRWRKTSAGKSWSITLVINSHVWIMLGSVLEVKACSTAVRTPWSEETKGCQGRTSQRIEDSGLFETGVPGSEGRDVSITIVRSCVGGEFGVEGVEGGAEGPKDARTLSSLVWRKGSNLTRISWRSRWSRGASRLRTLTRFSCKDARMQV